MRLIWSQPAFEDLRGINDYLRQHDPRAAIAALRAINAKAKLLLQYPGSGPPLDEVQRYVSVSRTAYVLVYAIKRDRVEIHRVYDSRQDWLAGIERT
jgi:plasmid stabilization system protein ParE